MQNITKALISGTGEANEAFQGVLVRLGGRETNSKANALRSPN